MNRLMSRSVDEPLVSCGPPEPFGPRNQTGRWPATRSAWTAAAAPQLLPTISKSVSSISMMSVCTRFWLGVCCVLEEIA